MIVIQFKDLRNPLTIITSMFVLGPLPKMNSTPTVMNRSTIVLLKGGGCQTSHFLSLDPSTIGA